MKTRTLCGPMTAVLVTALVAACGGGSKNARLKSKVNQGYLAPVSAEMRAHEATAFRDVFLANWQIQYTEKQIAAAELDIKIAKNELASAKIGANTADIKQEAAEEVEDVNRIEAATHDGNVADKEIDMQRLAVERAKKNLSFLKKRLEHEQRELRRVEAKLELSRAESLKTAGIRPPDFKAKTYEAQYNERVELAKSSKAGVDAAAKELAAIDAKLEQARAAASGLKAAAPPEPVAESTPAPPVPSEPVDEAPPAETAPAATPSEPKTEAPPAETKSAPAKPAPAKPTAAKPADPKATEAPDAQPEPNWATPNSSQSPKGQN